MKKISYFIYTFTAVMLMLWLLPWTIKFFTAKPSNSPFILYSSVIKDFAYIDIQKERDLKYCDLSGNKYTEREFDSILPFFYTRQLIQDERLPDSINGIKISPKLIQHENFIFISKPYEININKIGLYFLMESMSKRIDLKMPDDVFRTTSQGIEFIDMKSNEINEAKSKLFTETMKNKGLVFPIIEINGNPTTRKEYDEGYVILDYNNNLFHFKMVKGRPYVRKIELPNDITLKHLFITEFNNRKTLAFATDVNNKFFVISNKTYEVSKVAIPSFNPEKETIRIIANMLDWTIQIDSETRNDYYAINANDFSLIQKYENQIEKTWNGLHFTEYTDNYVYPRF